MAQKKYVITGTNRIYDKSDAGSGGYFVKMPTDLTNYVLIPGYRPEYSYLYTLIVDYFNSEEGYAYPSEWQLSRKYGKGVKAVRTHLRELERFGLITIKKRGRNKTYVPFIPLSRDELFRKCPEAAEKYREELRKEQAEYDRERNG